MQDHDTDYRTYYTVSGENPGSNGLVTIDNRPVTISINVTKQWTRSSEAVTNRNSISYTLYKAYAQTTATVDNVTVDQLNVDKGTEEVGKVNYVTADSGWQTVTIGNLPLYERVVATDGESTTVTYYRISYYVVETGAAADPGYVLTTAYCANTGEATTAVGAAVSTDGDKITIINTETAGVELPATGGTGTRPYTLTGLTLLLGASLILYYRRRRREQN